MAVDWETGVGSKAGLHATEIGKAFGSKRARAHVRVCVLSVRALVVACVCLCVCVCEPNSVLPGVKLSLSRCLIDQNDTKPCRRNRNSGPLIINFRSICG